MPSHGPRVSSPARVDAILGLASRATRPLQKWLNSAAPAFRCNQAADPPHRHRVERGRASRAKPLDAIREQGKQNLSEMPHRCTAVQTPMGAVVASGAFRLSAATLGFELPAIE